jgi:ribosomal protein L28
MVHVLVAEHFISKKPSIGHQVDHKDGVKRNNHISNLEWVTVSENRKRAFKLGLMNQDGERHPSAKLNNKKVREIIKSKRTSKELSIKFNVSASAISLVRRGGIWSHITGIKYEKKKSGNLK